MSSITGSQGGLVISLDFEKYWGMRDKKSVNDYKENLMNVDEVIFKTLELFEKYEIRATWATVGFLHFKNLSTLKNALPKTLPEYRISHLDPYRYINTLPDDVNLEDYHFAQQTIDVIMKSSGQELATHTFSHLYFLEEGVSKEACKEDLLSAITQATGIGETIDSIIFPRNQYNDDTLDLLKEVGIRVYRGNEKSWLYKASKDEEQSRLRRGLRLIDATFNLVGHQTSKPELKGGMINIPSSRFLRPLSSVGVFNRLHNRRIKKSMLYAAKTQATYHLWWHPHNFGVNIDENFDRLEMLLQYYRKLKDEYGFQSMNMQDFLRIG